VSAANCSFKPKMGSRGAISTAVNRDMKKVLVGGCKSSFWLAETQNLG
jgi:hypothetical protein